MKPRGVAAEIRQARPFRSKKQEATIALLRTASVVGRALSRALEPWGLSLAQYNALRIIRGAGTNGIATLAIRDRMIEVGTPITRVLDKLEAAGYVRRERGPDRRQVLCFVTAESRRLLDKIDPSVDAADEAVMAPLNAQQIAALIALLDSVRSKNAKGAVSTS